MLQNDKKKTPPTIDSSIPIYEQVIFRNHIIDQNSIELENNVAYGPIHPKIN